MKDKNTVKYPLNSKRVAASPKETLDMQIANMENEMMKKELLLQKLEETAEKLSVKLTYEDLHKGEVNTHGGMFRLRSEKRIIVHKGLNTDEKIDVLIEILASLDTNEVHLAPEVRELLDSAKKDKAS